MSNITEVQKKVLSYIYECMYINSIPPTLREIATYFNWKAVGSAQDVVNSLKRKGLLLLKEAGKARQFYLSDDALFLVQKKTTAKNIANKNIASQIIYVPLLNSLKLENFTQQLEKTENKFPFFINKTKFDKNNCFALVLDNEKIITNEFLTKDVLLIERCNNIKTGNVVVGFINNKIIINRYAKFGSLLYKKHIEKILNYTHCSAILVPNNETSEPIPVNLNENNYILGIVRALFRTHI